MVAYVVKLFTYFVKHHENPEDTEALKLKRASLILLIFLIGPLAIVWGCLYFILGHTVSASIPLGYSLISMFNLWHFRATGNVKVLYMTQMTLVLFLPFLLMWSLGGFAQSSYVMIWSFFAPLAAISYDKSYKAFSWFYAFLVLVLFSVLINNSVIELHTDCDMPNFFVNLFYLLNIGGGFAGIFLGFKYFINKYSESTNTDFLTGMHNRRFFYDSSQSIIDKNIREATGIVIATVDIDDFKNINDSHGHDTGDIAIKEVAKILKKQFRKSDLTARFGGEEFCILLEEPVYENIEKIFERLRYTFEANEINTKGIVLKYTVSIGVAYGNCSDLDEMIKVSDEALYEAKNNGKNKVVIRAL